MTVRSGRTIAAVARAPAAATSRVRCRGRPPASTTPRRSKQRLVGAAERTGGDEGEARADDVVEPLTARAAADSGTACRRADPAGETLRTSAEQCSAGVVESTTLSRRPGISRSRGSTRRRASVAEAAAAGHRPADVERQPNHAAGCAVCAPARSCRERLPPGCRCGPRRSSRRGSSHRAVRLPCPDR